MKTIILNAADIGSSGLHGGHGIGDACDIKAKGKITRMQQHASHDGDHGQEVHIELSDVRVGNVEEDMKSYAKRRNAEILER